MKGSELHENAIVFDGLIVSHWSAEVFEDMRRGGLTGANNGTAGSESTMI